MTVGTDDKIGQHNVANQNKRAVRYKPIRFGIHHLPRSVPDLTSFVSRPHWLTTDLAYAFCPELYIGHMHVFSVLITT